MSEEENWTDRLSGKILIPKEIVQAEAFPGLAENEVSELDLPAPYRILLPNSFATRDYRIDRLTIMCETRDDGKLTIVSAKRY